MLRVGWMGAGEASGMIGTAQTLQELARCTLCPAGCPLSLARTAPDCWRSEYPLTASKGLCPRGSTLGEVLNHRRRIFSPARNANGRRLNIDFESAVRAILAAAGDKTINILLDGNVPCEQMVAAAAWCESWPQGKLCFVIEPSDRELLLGTEASGADYLSDDALESCDGFVIIGDAFAANRLCSRGIFDRRKAEPKTPIVVIDLGGGAAAKFATHRIEVGPGMELSALAALASAANIQTGVPGVAPSREIPSTMSAGQAISGCERLGVIIAAEYGRTNAWRQIGYLAGKIAKAMGGGLAPQTVGANALAAVRLGERLQAVSLAEALSSGPAGLVVLGCDILGMFGWSQLPFQQAGVRILAAAAALPNATTESAEIILPLSMPGEVAGTYLFAGAQQVQVAPLLACSAGVGSAVDVVAALATAAGAAKPDISSSPGPLERLDCEISMQVSAAQDSSSPVLVLARDAMHCGCGAITGHGSWQAAMQELPELRVAQEDAQQMKLKNLGIVTVRTSRSSVRARVRFAPELGCGTMVLSEGLPQARALIPCKISSEDKAIVSLPASVEVS